MDPRYGQILVGREVCAVAGTPDQMSDVPGQSFVIQALIANTGNIMIGDSTVDITNGTEKGIELVPGQSVTLYITNTNLLYLDADNSGDGVSYIGLA